MRAMNHQMPVVQLELKNLCIHEYEQLQLCDLTSVRSVSHVSTVWYEASMKCHSFHKELSSVALQKIKLMAVSDLFFLQAFFQAVSLHTKNTPIQ